MNSGEAEQLGKCIRAAFDFAGHVGSSPPEPLSYYDAKALPAPREWIEMGIRALVIISRDDRSKGHPIQWGMMLGVLRHYQPGVGDMPVGMGALMGRSPLSSHAGGALRENERTEMLAYMERVRESEQRASKFKEMAAREGAQDEGFLEQILGHEWQEHVRMAQDLARQMSVSIEDPRKREAALRQLEEDQRLMRDLAERSEAAVRGRIATLMAEQRNVPMATADHEAASRESTKGTNPAPATYRMGMGCQATATMISEARNGASAGLQRPIRVVPEVPPAQEQTTKPPSSGSEQQRSGSLGPPLAVVGCALAAAVCASGGDSQGWYCALCWLLIGIPLVLIYFHRRRKVA
jgi:hypothetical protein